MYICISTSKDEYYHRKIYDKFQIQNEVEGKVNKISLPTLSYRQICEVIIKLGNIDHNKISLKNQ